MRVRSLFVYLLYCSLVVLPACCCFSATCPEREGSVADIPAAATIVVSAGEPATIALPENPTTGYRWLVEESPAEGVAVIGSSQYRLPSRAAVGAGGTRIFTLKAVAAGETRVVFEYRRPWEKNVAAVQRREFVVRVK